MLLFVILHDSDLKNLLKFSSSGLEITQISKEIHMEIKDHGSTNPTA